MVPNPKGPMEVWWLVRSGHSWLLFPDQQSHSVAWWSGPDAAVLDSPMSTAFLRGLGAFLLALLCCVRGLLAALVPQWSQAGARLLGGCRRTSLSTITELAQLAA
ncbi:hypothetical protein [Luteococcus sp.]|uniref:hypothetical protein n=1 Tax=Luteococcus sp. TaxID=1969402 RepID=UPI0037369BC2